MSPRVSGFFRTESVPKCIEIVFGAQGLYYHVNPYLYPECIRFVVNLYWKCIHVDSVSLSRIGTRIRIIQENNLDFQLLLNFQILGTRHHCVPLGGLRQIPKTVPYNPCVIMT